MKIFVSWSGDASLKVALALREWLPKVIQILQIYVSSEDIDKGARWLHDISGELADTNFGILCVTKDNVEAPWLNFEAGAISKSVDRSRVAPFLFNLDRSEVTGPIVQFQSTIYEKADFRKLVETINVNLEARALERSALIETFEVWWPKLDEQLQQIKAVDTMASAAHSRREGRPANDAEQIRAIESMMREVLELSRQQIRSLGRQDANSPPRQLKILGGERGYQRLDTFAMLQLLESWQRLVDGLANSSISNDDIARLNSIVRAGRKAAKHLEQRFGPTDDALRAFGLGFTLETSPDP